MCGEHRNKENLQTMLTSTANIFSIAWTFFYKEKNLGRFPIQVKQSPGINKTHEATINKYKKSIQGHGRCPCFFGFNLWIWAASHLWYIIAFSKEDVLALQMTVRNKHSVSFSFIRFSLKLVLLQQGSSYVGSSRAAFIELSKVQKKAATSSEQSQITCLLTEGEDSIHSSKTLERSLEH